MGYTDARSSIVRGLQRNIAYVYKKLSFLLIRGGKYIGLRVFPVPRTVWKNSHAGHEETGKTYNKKKKSGGRPRHLLQRI